MADLARLLGLFPKLDMAFMGRTRQDALRGAAEIDRQTVTDAGSTPIEEVLAGRREQQTRADLADLDMEQNRFDREFYKDPKTGEMIARRASGREAPQDERIVNLGGAGFGVAPQQQSLVDPIRDRTRLEESQRRMDLLRGGLGKPGGSRANLRQGNLVEERHLFEQDQQSLLRQEGLARQESLRQEGLTRQDSLRKESLELGERLRKEERELDEMVRLRTIDRQDAMIKRKEIQDQKDRAEHEESQRRALKQQSFANYRSLGTRASALIKEIRAGAENSEDVSAQQDELKFVQQALGSARSDLQAQDPDIFGGGLGGADAPPAPAEDPRMESLKRIMNNPELADKIRIEARDALDGPTPQALQATRDSEPARLLHQALGVVGDSRGALAAAARGVAAQHVKRLRQLEADAVKREGDPTALSIGATLEALRKEFPLIYQFIAKQQGAFGQGDAHRRAMAQAVIESVIRLVK